MERHNLVVPIVGDFAGDKSLRAVAKYLKDHEATVSVFYVSNVEQYLFQNNPAAINGGAQKFYENVAALPLDRSSRFIRVSNIAVLKQVYPGFTTHLGLVSETLRVFSERGLKSVREVFDLPRE
jgi:hypothetical protein